MWIIGKETIKNVPKMFQISPCLEQNKTTEKQLQEFLIETKRAKLKKQGNINWSRQVRTCLFPFQQNEKRRKNSDNFFSLLSS